MINREINRFGMPILLTATVEESKVRLLLGFA
jgi:hypothetical protein